jgi:hypothetical protein
MRHCLWNCFLPTVQTIVDRHHQCFPQLVQVLYTYTHIQSTWASQVKSLLSDLGYSYLWDADTVSRAQLHSLVQRLYDQNAQHWFSLIENSSKLDTYCIFKLEYCVEKYVSCINIEKTSFCVS